MSVAANWTDESAFNLPLAQQESRQWIEAVTREKFVSNDFQQSLKDGKLLCKLINQIKPGVVKKINNQSTDFAEMENISFFVNGAKSLGLKDTQVFTSKELHEKNGRIRDVVISLYWLGRAARGIPTYKGPHLNLNAFHGGNSKMKCSKCKQAINDDNYLATMDQQFHRACATCCKCKKGLDPKEPFYQLGNDFYCPACMVSTSKMHNESPASTGHAHGGQNCGRCKKSLNGVDHVHGDDGKDYCISCVCDGCHNPLKGNEVTKGNKKYCPDCICSDCTKPFGPDGYFETETGKKICPACSEKPAKNQTAPKAAQHGHQHSHGPGHDHSHSPSSSNKGSPTPTKNENKNGCNNCNKPLNNKKKHGHDCDKYCDPCEKDFCCGTCHNEINGPAVGAFGNKYHPECFNCTNCKKNIPKNNLKFQQNNQQPYCNPCYDSMFGKFGACAGCGNKLDRNGIEALGQRWHPQCFNCTKCKASFPSGEYIEHENKPYCSKCAPKATGGDCYACKKPLSGQVTQVMNNFWHFGCFACCGCRKAFTTGYTVWEGLPYCEPCHLQRSADRCQLCAKPMVGEVVKVKGKQWHKGCFNCTVCHKDLTKTGEQPDVFIKFSKPYCRTCNPPSGASKFCSHCGTPATGGNFCNSCGGKL